MCWLIIYCLSFSDLSPHAEHFTCEVQMSSRRGLGSFVGRDPVIGMLINHCMPSLSSSSSSSLTLSLSLPSFLGRVHIHFSDLPNGQEDDKWHQLLQTGGGARAAPRGSLRLVANFKDHMILPLEEYDKLKQVGCQKQFRAVCKKEREGDTNICPVHAHTYNMVKVVTIYLQYLLYI